MKTIRLNAWNVTASGIFISDAARQFVAARRLIVNSFILSGDDGQQCKLDIFKAIPGERLEPVVIISPESATWSEEAVKRLFDENGSKRAEKWEGVTI